MAYKAALLCKLHFPSDDSVAPNGHENLFLLMPIASGLQEDESLREKYFDIMMGRMKNIWEETSGI